MVDLTPTDYAFLILLKIEGREITNPEMASIHGVRLLGDNLARLNGQGFVDSDTSRRPYRHKLSATAAKVLSDPFEVGEEAKRNSREQQLWAALAALHNSHLNGTSRPRTYTGLDERIRDAYDQLATEAGTWVSLKRLRPLLRDVSKADLDEALERLLKAPDVDLEPEPNQKTLKNADRRAAVRIGGEDRHLLAIGMR